MHHTKQFVDADLEGNAVHVHATNYVPYGTVYWQELYRNYEITQGLFLQKATHDFDYLMFLMGSPVVRIGAMGTFQRVFGGSKPAGLHCGICDEVGTCLESPANRMRNCAGGGLGNHNCLYSVDCGDPESGTNEDCSSAVFEFASGAHGVYSQVFFTRRDAGSRGAVVSGYRGTIGFDWYRNEIKRVRHHEPFTDISKASGGASHFGGDAELARDFLSVILGNGTSRTGIETGIQSVYTCLAAKESMGTGQFADVRQVGHCAN